MDFYAFLYKVSIWAIPVLSAVALHEVAHGWMARLCGDRTAEMLGRLSLNPLRHIDPIGTVLVPCLLLIVGGPIFGWAKPVPVATTGLQHPRRAMVLVALAGPGANLILAAICGAVFGMIARVDGNETLDGWIALMAQAGMVFNVALALFNLIPIPPLDGGRVLASLLPPHLGTYLRKIEPIGLAVVLGFSVLGMLGWLFEPAYRAIGHVVQALTGSVA